MPTQRNHYPFAAGFTAALILPLLFAGCSGLANMIEGQQQTAPAPFKPTISSQEAKPLCVIVSAYMNYYQKNFGQPELDVIGSVLNRAGARLRDNAPLEPDDILVLAALRFYFGHVGVTIKISTDEKFNTLLALEAAQSLARRDARFQFISVRLGDVLKGLQDAEAKGAVAARIINLPH